MPNWAPTTFEQCTIKYSHIEGVNTPLAGNTLAEWNLAWLFDYQSMSKIDGTLAGNMAHHTALNVKASAAIIEDVKDNPYKIKDLAETLGPVEFLDTYMRRPYQHTMLYSLCGEDIFTEARANAEKLAQGMRDRAGAAHDEALEAIQTAKILAFKRLG